LGEWRTDGDALAVSGAVAGHKVRLLKPQTYYNLSGQALRPFLKRPFWAPQSDLLVVGDDVALPVGTFRVRRAGARAAATGSSRSSARSATRTTRGCASAPGRRTTARSATSSSFVLAPFDASSGARSSSCSRGSPTRARRGCATAWSRR
jgi:PTH1 family peptidyl-tRNA hydrolase